MNKYRNKKTVVDGIRFASLLEATRYGLLKLLLNAGEITNLRMQVRYQLYAGDKPILIRSARYKNGRKATYVADFVYQDKKDATVIEDAKGKRTTEFILKKAIMETMGHSIVEIRGRRK